MAQNAINLPVTGVYSGLQAAGYINDANATLNTDWLGSSAPSDAPNGIPATGQKWIDTSSAGYQIVKRYDGASWVIDSVIDTTNHILLNPIGGGVASIASASTTSLGTLNEAFLTITGNTTITSFGGNVPYGQAKIVTFSGSLILTHSASLQLPGAANITTAAGDMALFVIGSGSNWYCVNYQRASGAQTSMTGAAASVASASTTDLASGGSNAVTVTGTTTITSFGSNATTANPYYFVRFSGALILTYNGTSLIIPGGANITTAAGDWAVCEYLGSGNWRINSYQRTSGQCISLSGAETNLASASTCDLGSVASNCVNITGTTTITAFGSSAVTANPFYFVKFAGALTLTHNSTSLILPGGGNITTTAGDTAIFQYLGSGNWRCWSYFGATSPIASVNAGQVAGKRNLLINGAFNVWQRGTSFTENGGYQYCADRWKFAQSAGSANFTVTRQSGTNQLYACRIQRTAAAVSTANLFFTSALETIDSIPARGKYVTVTVWLMKGADLSGDITLSLYSGTGTDESIPRSFTGVATIGSLTVTAASISAVAPSAFSFTTTAVVAASVTQLGVQIQKSNSGTAGAADWVQAEAFQIEFGSVATPFENRGFADDLDTCQRYYQKSFLYTTAPAQNAGTTGAIAVYLPTGASGTFGTFVPLKSMRIAPTVTTYNPSAANANWRDTTGGADRTVTVGDKGTNSFQISGASGVAATVNRIHYGADAEL